MANWNLGLIYRNDDVFEEDFNKLVSLTSDYKKFITKLNNQETIKEYLKHEEEVELLLERIYIYTSMSFDLNQKDHSNQKRKERVLNLYSKVVEASSFASSELVKISLNEFKSWAMDDEFLNTYSYYFDKLHHGSCHILDSNLEGLIAKFKPSLDNYSELYGMLRVGDNDGVMVTLSDGSEVEINEANYRLYLEKLESQEDRTKVFEAVFKFYEDHKNTFFGVYKGVIEKDYANAKARNYNTILDSFLDNNNIPTSVYLNLLKTTREHTDVVKKYCELRKEYFNLDMYHSYDRFLKFTKCDKIYTFEDTKSFLLAMIKDMPQEFKEAANIVIEEGRIDTKIRDGKTADEYSTAITKEGPFILLNHSGSIDNLFTFVHEVGHSIHSVLSTANQSFATKDYVAFVAEIASTFNEQLLLDYLVSHTDDDNLKLVLLQQAIDNIIAIFYRETLFADCEYQAHKLREDGKVITLNILDEIIKDLYKQYYGIDLNKERYKEHVWAYNSLFFQSPFYVYQYATSFAASMAIFNDIKDKKPGAMESYMEMLKSGGSDYPINIVKKAHVDLASDKPYLAVTRRLEELVEKLKNALKK